MPIVLKPGARLRSVTCATEVVVVGSPVEADLRCGGRAMVDIGTANGPIDLPVAGFDKGTQIGKRYADEETGLEVLCTKAGTGSLSIGDTPLEVRGAKLLPASD
jgi:hypothetical protein